MRLKPHLQWRVLLIALLSLSVIMLATPTSHADSYQSANQKMLRMQRLFSPEHRVDSSRNMDKVFPARHFAASSKPQPFGQAPVPLPEHYQYQGRQQRLAAFFQRTETSSFLVIKNDQIIAEQYLMGADASTLFTSWSVAKSFTATLIGMAVLDGKIKNLDDPITAYVPELTDSAWNNVSIRHILQMASGVEFDESPDNQVSDMAMFMVRVFGMNMRADNQLYGYDVERPAGEQFQYVSPNSQVLGLLLRKLYHKPLAQLLQQRIWQPLGMESAAFWSTDKTDDSGVELAFCCLNATTRDFAKLGRLYLNNGLWQGKPLLPNQWVKQATQASTATFDLKSLTGGGLGGYGYHWWLPPEAEGEYFAFGVWGQYLYVSEPDQLIIVRTAVDADFIQHTGEMLTVFRAVRNHLSTTR